MARQWLELRKDWNYPSLAKWLLVRSLFVSGRALGWLTRETIKGFPVAVELLSLAVEKVALALTKVTPGIRKWAVLSQVWVDDAFAVPDRGLKRILDEVDAIPYGGRYEQIGDAFDRPLAQIQPGEVEGRQISTEDISKAIALYDGSVLIACRSGAGKTTTIQSAIAHAGDCDFWIFDGKGSCFNGLEKNPERYFLCNHPSLIVRAVEALEHLVTVVMKGRQDRRLANGGTHPERPRRIVVICDEFNNIVTFAEMVKLANDLCNLVTLLINMGREDLVNWWGVAQTHLVGEVNLSTGVQKSLAFVCQGRDTQYQSIEGALCDRNIISNSDERKRLQQQLAYYAQTETDQSQPICFTTIGGKRLVKLPSLGGVKPPSLKVIQQTDSECLYNQNGFQNGHNALPLANQGASTDLTKNTPGRTAPSGFQPPSALQKGISDPKKSPENQAFQPSSGTWESQWESRFWEIWQAIQDGRSNYWIGGNLFGVTGGSSYQRLCERLDNVRSRLGTDG